MIRNSRARAQSPGGGRRGLCFAAAPTMKAAMRDLEETMQFDPDEGIANLDAHLDRLKSAADAQGFRFDRHAARNELQAATFGKRRPAVARLLLSPTGAMAIEVRALD
jgi:para-aminobenzoate synthetase/4-amino-4-deoxychorismate lyase